MKPQHKQINRCTPPPPPRPPTPPRWLPRNYLPLWGLFLVLYLRAGEKKKKKLVKYIYKLVLLKIYYFFQFYEICFTTLFLCILSMNSFEYSSKMFKSQTHTVWAEWEFQAFVDQFSLHQEETKYFSVSQWSHRFQVYKVSILLWSIDYFQAQPDSLHTASTVYWLNAAPLPFKMYVPEKFAF